MEVKAPWSLTVSKWQSQVPVGNILKSSSLQLSNFLKKSRPLNITDLAEIWYDG